MEQVQIITMTDTQLKELVKQTVCLTIAEYKLEQPEQEEKRMLTKQETMEILGVSESTLLRWAKANYLTPVHVGSKVRYRTSDVFNLQ